MKIKKLLFILIVFIYTFVSNSAWSASEDSFRCGSNVIQLGDKSDTVLKKCGEPNATLENVKRDLYIWYYDLGENRFTRTLFISGGIVRYIDMGPWGNRPKSIQ
jgi:hypothetical protein